MDVLLVDTAGRLAIDDAMMDEIRGLHGALKPAETLFVVDAMTGQDAAATAAAFGEALPLTGVVLTKTDGDARGGAALSVRMVTGKPIKFLGSGEKTDALETFHPDRIASRILGMGDVVSLVEEVTAKVDHAKAEKFAKKMQKGKAFDLNDLKEQLEQMAKMGGMAALMDKMPGMADVPDAVKAQANDKQFVHMIALVNSMTEQERRFPGDPEGLQEEAHRRRRGPAGAGPQPPAEAAPADEPHDEEDGQGRSREDDARHEGQAAARHGRARGGHGWHGVLRGMPPFDHRGRVTGSTPPRRSFRRPRVSRGVTGRS